MRMQLRSAPALRTAALPWLLVAVGFASMYAPAYWAAMQTLWQSDDVALGPLMLAVTLWLAWQQHEAIASAAPQPAPAAGALLLGAGLLLYMAARVFSISSVEFASQLPVLAGCVLLLRGPALLRATWLPLLYLLFTVPLPASLVDTLTAPLKEWISAIVVDTVYALGYPIARAGVTILIGPYQLLVADACSGLNSMFSLSAVGVLFMYVMHRDSRWHNAIMLASILPIAFGANIVRVISLVLVTYTFGDEAGQGFLHGAAGLVLFLVALAMLLALDLAVAALLRGRVGVRPPRPEGLKALG